MDLEAERQRERRSKAVAVGLAVVLHVGFVLSIPAVRESIEIAIVGEAALEEEPPPPPPPAPEPPAPEPVRTPERRAEREPPPDAPPPPPTPTEPPPAAPPPEDFPDVLTNTSNTGSSDTIAPGERGGVAGGVRGGQQGGTVGGDPNGVVGGTGPLTAANLSRGPGRPSGLNNNALRRHYPLGPRRTGTPGHAIVRILLGPDGRVRTVSNVREDPQGSGFAQACKDTVLENGSGWEPALDAQGRPGSFSFTFRCDFEINQ